MENSDTPPRPVPGERRLVRQWELLRGCRYANCTVDNFDATSDVQRAVKAQVRELTSVSRVKEILGNGNNVIFFGPPGTGKDHLMSAMLRRMVLGGFSLHGVKKDSKLSLTWTTGPELLSKFRDFEDRETMKYLQRVGVLAVSDPVVSESLTAFQAERWYELADARYNAMRPTFMTANIANSKDLERLMSPQIADRLRHNAIPIHCNWPSYRKVTTYPHTPLGPPPAS